MNTFFRVILYLLIILLMDNIIHIIKMDNYMKFLIILTEKKMENLKDIIEKED